MRQVFWRGGAALEAVPRLRTGALLFFRHIGQQVQRPGQRQGGGFVPCHDEELHVEDQVFGAEAVPGFRVLRGEHPRQQVVGGWIGVAAADLDGRAHHGMHHLHRTRGQQPSGAGKPFGHGKEIQQRGAAGGAEIFGYGFAERVAVEMFAARQGHVAEHVECRGQHLRDKFVSSAPRQPVACALRRRGHGRGQRQHVAMGENGRDRLALPFPVRAVGIEQAFPDGGTQHPLHDFGFGIVGQVVQHHPLHAGGIGQHVPAHHHLARYDGLVVGQGGNDLQHIAPGNHGGFDTAENAPVNWGADRNEVAGHVPV